MTGVQLEESAHAPCTRTTVGFAPAAAVRAVLDGCRPGDEPGDTDALHGFLRILRGWYGTVSAWSCGGSELGEGLLDEGRGALWLGDERGVRAVDFLGDGVHPLGRASSAAESAQKVSRKPSSPM
jgi:hypothetical protein